MIEAAVSVLSGGLIGGLLRLAPEVLKFFDRASERVHEFKMTQLQNEFESARWEHQADMAKYEAGATYATQGIDALKSAIKQQVEMVKLHPALAWLSSTVRPVITYLLVAAYLATKWAAYSMMAKAGMGLEETILKLWGSEDWAMLSGVINYWFINRTLEKGAGLL